MVNFNLVGATHHPAIEAIVNTLCTKIQNTDRGFFRVEAAYFLAKIAGCMRANVNTKDRGSIPLNVYALALAGSGYGKGHSIAIMENHFLNGFQNKYVNTIYPEKAKANIESLVQDYVKDNPSLDSEELFNATYDDFLSGGAFPFTFDSGTVPAIKQLRHSLLLAGSGSFNYQVDEIGSNLVNSLEVLTAFLELYDQGFLKQKLIKNTAENKRMKDIIGKTPANMLLFGTPAKLFDGGFVEDNFYSLLETGYARRCLFGYGIHKRMSQSMTSEEIYAELINPSVSREVERWQNHFTSLADMKYHSLEIELPDEQAIKLISYKTACETEADNLPEHEDLKKAEVSHRYFKALKLAGIYAFIDKSPKITDTHLMSAILLVEDSGLAFKDVLNREKPYVKLAKFIASEDSELTHADLHSKLPFYKSGVKDRSEIMALARAWGYKNHIVIKERYEDNIQLFKGERLDKTDLNKIIISHSTHLADGYQNVIGPFNQLPSFLSLPNQHWLNHHVKDGKRDTESILPPFNLVVVDVDGGIKLETAQELLKEYKFITHTTKRHTEELNRFRLLLPINYTLHLDPSQYKEFMNGILDWLPFKSDPSAAQIAQKWETTPTAKVFYNEEGSILDVLSFIPETPRYEKRKKQIVDLGSLDNLERWYAERMASGNRNNHMIKYALLLLEGGWDVADIRQQLIGFNSKLSNPLEEREIDTTIMKTVATRSLENKGEL